MKLDAVKFGFAFAITAAVLWIICSLLVWAFPSMMMQMSGDMVHGDLSQMGWGWHLSLSGVFFALILWSVTAGITGWLIAYSYNRLI